MKKTRILAVLLAAVLLFAAIPVTVGADSEKGGIVKDVVDFDGSYVTSESYFALGSSLYDKDGNKLFTLENENEVIYTLTDNCIITVVGDSDFTDLVSLELSFKLYTMEDGSLSFKSEFENYPLVMQYNGWDYTAVLHVDLSGIFDYEDLEDLTIYGYDIIDSYGNVIHTESGPVVAEPVSNGVFTETKVRSIGSIQSIVTVEDGNVKRVDLAYSLCTPTELGDVIVWDFNNKCGVVDHNGKEIVPCRFDEIAVIGDYYVGLMIDNDDPFAYSSSAVYTRSGKHPFSYYGGIVYYNGDVAIAENYSYDPEFGDVVTYTVLSDSSTVKELCYGDKVYVEGDYIICQGYGITNMGVTILDLKGNVVSYGMDWDVQSIDTKNGSVIVTDYSTCESYRVDRSMNRVETLEFLDYYVMSYDNVAVRHSYPTEEDESYCLVYKGKKISQEFMMFESSFVMDGCEVYVFINGDDIFSEDLTYTAYIISGDKCPFYDIDESHWAASYITSCFDAGIMNGTGNGKFSPDMAVSRAQVVTTLWRLAGSPTSEESCDFVDVADGMWYTEAVAWAAECGITTGVGGNYFAPDRNVTRGEVAAIIFRFAEAMGEDTDGRAELSDFADTDELADWNRDAFAWCVDSGIITGKTGARLAPTDVLTRAEISAILCRVN
ncbi:MAG: S-layer homology domain-containing protein [Clostridia bacterium]|nr:S-layer homology domain-containing protein [Clostridia bacterium]